MQYLENDMDDLFKRAAENYPLKTGKGAWETIADRLKAAADKTGPVRSFKKRMNKELFALVLVFSTLSIGESVLQPPKTGLSYPSTDIIINDDKIDSGGLKQKDISISGNTLNHVKKLITGSLNVTGNGWHKSDQQHLYPSYINKKSAIISKQNSQPRETINDNDRGSLLLYEPVAALYDMNDIALHKHAILSAKNENILSLNESTKQTMSVAKKISQKKEHSELSKRKAFYIGIAAGSDFSKVQSMAFNNSGFNAGLIAVVKLAGRTSFETGILWSRKKYNSAGNEFKMDKIGSTMPAGMVINSVEAKSSLIEIPFKIKYDFLNRANATWFASAGISAYIMTTEDNRYHVTMNGNTEMMTGVYRNYNYGLPAVANISAGYQKNLSKFINIRIEPFLKIPLQGMGVGNLPITSAGLQVGITRLLK
ncbi:MAG: porin family protein [Ferruginibacter sp.]